MIKHATSLPAMVGASPLVPPSRAPELRPHGVRVNAVSPGPTTTARFLATRTTDPAMMDGVPPER